MELLISIVVIALLAAILGPALSRVRQAAGSTRCLNNLRQLTLAASLYWDDHQGRAFPERLHRTQNGWLYWFGWLGDGQEGERSFDPASGPLWPYFGTVRVTDCPQLIRNPHRFKAKANGAAHGYAYNLLMGPRNRAPVNTRNLLHPNAIAVFVDAAQINDFQPPASPDRPMLEEFYYFGTNHLEATLHFRHSAMAMTGFGDGHVSLLPPAPGSIDDRLPPEIIGRISEFFIVPR